jgi:Zn-finger nucleic acid-binding protein
VTHENGRQPLPCPTCRTDLDATVIDKTLIDLCANCGGVWVDHAAFEKLISDRTFSDLASALNIPGWAAQQSTAIPSDKDAFYVHCPLCEHFMHRRNYAKRSGIILDVCAAHGIWFDANELARVLNYRIADNDAASMRPSTGAPQEMTMPVPNSTGSDHLSGRSGIELLVAMIVRFLG